MSRKMRYGPDYDPTVNVPEEWQEFRFEYIHGWSWGSKPWVHNPVSLKSDSDGNARAAWSAGREACKRNLEKR